jgi:hypothetical protein
MTQALNAHMNNKRKKVEKKITIFASVREHINHIQVLGFLPFPYSSRARSSLSVWPMSNNIGVFVLGL